MYASTGAGGIVDERRARGIVWRRDGGRCVWCGTSVGLSVHHRLPRGMGGTSRPHWSPPRLVLLCGHGTAGDHGRVESDRAWAYAVGLLVPRPRTGYDETEWCAARPLLLQGRRPVLLTVDGRYEWPDTATPPGSASLFGSDSRGAWPW